MIRKTRVILLALFAFLYLAITPILLLYSFGYRFDFENWKISGTGGLHLRIQPQGANILVDNKISKRTGLLSGEALFQGLLAKEHNVLVSKDGYFPWQKTLEVKNNEVTSAENIILIKKKIIFDKIKSGINNFFVSPNGGIILIFDSSEDNFSLFDLKTKTRINSFSLPSKNISIASWNENDRKIIILSGKNYFSINYSNSGEIVPKLTIFKTITQVGTLSPDKSKILFFNDHEISYSNAKKPDEKIFLYRFTDKIDDCFWMGNNYLIFNLNGQIKISEIDVRDNVNIVTVSQFKNPKLYWDEANKKIYILNQNTLFASEPIY